MTFKKKLQNDGYVQETFNSGQPSSYFKHETIVSLSIFTKQNQ